MGWLLGLGLWSSLAVVAVAEPVASDMAAMLRVVEDPEGTVNVRRGPSTKEPILTQLPNGSPVVVLETRKEWLSVEGDVLGGDGWIHGSRLARITEWEQWKVTVGEEAKEASIDQGGWRVTVTSAPFSRKGRKLTKDAEGIPLIDGRQIWGTDGTLPGRTLSLAVQVDGKPVDVPSRAWSDLFEPNLESLVLLKPKAKRGEALVVMWNSDGAGGYLVVWAFRDGRYVGRALLYP